MRCHVWLVFVTTLGVASLIHLAGGVGDREPGAVTSVADAKKGGQKSEGAPPLKVDKNAPRLDEPNDGSRNSAKAAERAVADNSACYVCHANYKEEPFAQAHAKANVGCVTCHSESRPHRADEGNVTPPDVMFAPEDVAPLCARCHQTHNVPPEKIIARWQERCRSKTNPKDILCTDCHGDHRLKIRTIRWDKKTRKPIIGGKDQRTKPVADSPKPLEENPVK